MEAGGSIAFEGAEIGCATEGATVITFVAVAEEEFGAASNIGRIESFESEGWEDACGRDAVACTTNVETG